MKKNKMMRFAALLLVAVILTTCAISGTFAKYVTSDYGSDSARVARWGVTITANGDTFADAYAKESAGNKKVAYATADATVKAGTEGTKVVAPGTKGDMVSMTLDGTPEVAVKVTYKATQFKLTNWVVDNNDYCPLVFKVGENSFKIGDSGINSVTELETAVKNAIESYSKEYYPGTALSGVTAESLNVSWEWPFSTSDENDIKDTALGNAADPGTVELTITTTATQID